MPATRDSLSITLPVLGWVRLLKRCVNIFRISQNQYCQRQLSKMSPTPRVRFLVTHHTPVLPTQDLDHQVRLELGTGVVLFQDHDHHPVLVVLSGVVHLTQGPAHFLALAPSKEHVLDLSHHRMPAEGKLCAGDEAYLGLCQGQGQDLLLRHAGSQDVFLVQSHPLDEVGALPATPDLRLGKRNAGILLP